MFVKDVTVQNQVGLHARPAALIAQACISFKSIVTIETEEAKASGSDVLQILRLQAKQGSNLKISIFPSSI